MRFDSGLLRACLALALLGVLSACAGNPQRPTGSVFSPSSGRSVEPPGPPGDPWGPWIREASRRFDVPERWIREVMRQESGGRASATSPVGAMGLMQVMPGTYRELQSRYGLGDDPYHPYDSIMAGTAYIREMYDQFGSPAFLAAYNAGPRRLENFLYNRQGLPAETRNYVARVGPGVIRSSPVRRAAPEVYAAAEIPLNVPQGPRRMDSGTMMALREQRGIREQNAQFARLPDVEAPSVVARAQAPVPMRGGSVVAMEPIPDGSTAGGALALAESAARGSALGGEQRIVVASMDPIPDGSTPGGAAALAEAEARNRTPAQPFAAARTATVATMPLPPRTLGFIGTAQASTLPAPLRPAVANQRAAWAIQVGAFSDERQARTAAEAARAGGRVDVQPVRVGRATLFRARVTGLSQPAAQQACDRIRGRACMVLSPDQQG
ncbi:MAG: lytic transglycosylase domain-containing protein [Alphaproteobacteria bacterium]|nr:lytic transglycosylase domain-containing protein [Alphaproteobacteria bacterium]